MLVMQPLAPWPGPELANHRKPEKGNSGTDGYCPVALTVAGAEKLLQGQGDSTPSSQARGGRAGLDPL